MQVSFRHCLLIPSIAGVSRFFFGNYNQNATFVIPVMLKYFVFMYLYGRVRDEKESGNAHLSRGQEFGKYHYFGNATIIKVKVANNLVVIQVHVKHVMDMCGSLKSIR